MGRPAPKQRVSQVFPIGAPIGGIDDTSSLANMDTNYAVDMLNYFPESGSLKVRSGYMLHVENMTANGDTIMVYNNVDGTQEMFCATDDGIYDVTLATDTPVVVHAALTNGDVSWTQFSNIAGHWLIGCNGVDAPFIYDGSTWVSFTNVAVPAAPGQITSGTVAVADLVFVHVHKNRVWFIERDSMSAWYLDLNAVSGDATEFPVGGIFSRGGYLSSLFSLTMDSGVGSDDVLVFQSSKGELAGYAGANPDTTTDWGLIARYFVGSPLGRKTNVQRSGDVLMLTEFGVISAIGVISGEYQLGARDSTANVSSRISRTISNLVRDRSGNPNWEMHTSPVFQYIVIQIKQLGAVVPQQLVMNSVTGAWTKFDLPVLTLQEFGQNIYFSDSSGNIWSYGSGDSDAAPSPSVMGNEIIASFQQAYSAFESPTSNKHFKLLRPIIEANAIPGITVSISTDYFPISLDDVKTPTTGSSAIAPSAWDSAVWDSSVWQRTNTRFETLVGVYGIGYSASLLLKTSSLTSTRFISSHWVYELGISL